jgi:scyllo-inositol 2-dehydrogenase (NADP+)
VRYLVVGLGNIGQRRAALLGERCIATADPFNSAAEYRSVKDVPLDSFDAAVLAIPDDDKVELVTYLLTHGKHVLVEKPLPLPDEATARTLEALAREKGLALYTAYNHRFEPLLVAFKEWMDAGAIGEVYHGRLFYGNGTVKHVAGTWRDHGLGAIQDLGCHLLDLLAFAAGGRGIEMHLVSALSVETVAPDRAIISSADGRFILEMTYHSWRNNFAFELYGEQGSIHCLGLRKWGGSELIVRKRVFPSGRPEETRQTDEGPDVTWELEVEQFERLCAAGGASTDLSTDWWIARTLRSLEAALPPPRTS